MVWRGSCSSYDGRSDTVSASSPPEEESKSSICIRCLAFLTFSGFGSAGEDFRTSLIGENIPRLASLGESDSTGSSSRTDGNIPRLTSLGDSDWIDSSFLADENVPWEASLGDPPCVGSSSLVGENIPRLASLPEYVGSSRAIAGGLTSKDGPLSSTTRSGSVWTIRIGPFDSEKAGGPRLGSGTRVFCCSGINGFCCSGRKELGCAALVGFWLAVSRCEYNGLLDDFAGGVFCSFPVCLSCGELALVAWGSWVNDSIDSCGCGDSLPGGDNVCLASSLDGFLLSSGSLSSPLPFLSFRLNIPPSMPLFSFRFLSSLLFSGGGSFSKESRLALVFN